MRRPGRRGSRRRAFANASSARVRAALIPEEAAEFGREWHEVMAQATRDLDLSSGTAASGSAEHHLDGLSHAVTGWGRRRHRRTGRPRPSHRHERPPGRRTR
ncbi:DUF6247 family protein [Pseudonocardia sp.]|uniref:DUF6247 family protein n=1 Tax=Pseudonocardia sp. TaxID=60912 RepID=UPI0039C9398D